MAHHGFNQLYYSKHIFLSQNFILDMMKYGQNQFIKEFPFKFEEEGEESSCYFGVSVWQNRCESTYNPLAGVHVYWYFITLKLLVDFRQVVLY